MVDPVLNFVNPTSRHLKFTRSDQKHVFSQAISARVDENKQELEESNKVINLETKRLIKAESTQYELDRPKYQLSRKTFKVGYSLSPQMFGATSSKISLNPSMNQTKLSPSHSGVMSHNYFNKIQRDQNIQIDAKECEIEARMEQAQQLNHQKEILFELLDYYKHMMGTTIGQMTVQNSLNISDLQQLIRRLNKSMDITNNRIKSVNDKQFDLMKGDVERALSDRTKMMHELTEFKETKTIEAYFSRFHKIPNVEDRKTLIRQMDEFLADEKIQLNANYGLKFDTAGVEQLLETFEEANDFGMTETDQMSPEGFELKMRAIVKEIKTVMLTEAEGVRRLTEKNVKDKLALTGGKVPMKNKGVGTEEWSKIHHRHQRAIEDLTIKLANLTEESEKTIKQLTFRYDQRGKELIAASAKAEVLEEFKKKMNISNIHKQLSDQLYDILSEHLAGDKVAEVMIKFQESIKMIDRNQKQNVSMVDNKEESIENQKKAGLFKQKVKKESFVVQDDENIDLEASPEPKAAQTTQNSTNQQKPQPNIPFVMPEFDKSTFKMIETNTESIKVIFKESENLLDHFHVKKENLINLEKQVIALGEAFKLIEKLATKMRFIISACEETQGTQIGPAVQLQALHLNTALDKLIQSGDFRISIKCTSQFQSLPNLRQVIDDVKRVKNMQDQFLTHEDETKRDNFFSEALFCCVQLLFFKEATIDLPNKNQLNKFGEVCSEVKDIRELLLALLTEDQIAFLSKATQTNRDYKLAFNDILDIKTQLIRCFPRNLQHELVKNEAVEILVKVYETSEMMGQIHRLPKELNLIIQKIYQIIKGNKRKGNKQVILKSDIQHLSQKEKNLKEKLTLQTLKEEDEELSIKFNSDNEAEIVLDKNAGKNQKKQAVMEAPKKAAEVKAPSVAQKLQKAMVKKVSNTQDISTTPAVKTATVQPGFSKVEVEQAVETAVQNAVQNALKAAIQKHESEMKAVKDELEQQKVLKEQLERSLSEKLQQNLSTELSPQNTKPEEVTEPLKKLKQQTQQIQPQKMKPTGPTEQGAKFESKSAVKKTVNSKQEQKSSQSGTKPQTKIVSQPQSNKKSPHENSPVNQSTKIQDSSSSPHRQKDNQPLEILPEEDEANSMQNDESRTELRLPDTPRNQQQLKVEQISKQKEKQEHQNAQQVQTLQNSLERLQESVIEEEDEQNFSPTESLMTFQKVIVIRREVGKDNQVENLQKNESDVYQEREKNNNGFQNIDRNKAQEKLENQFHNSKVDVIQITDQLENLDQQDDKAQDTPKIGDFNPFPQSPGKSKEEQTMLNSTTKIQTGTFEPTDSIHLYQSIETQHIVGNRRKESVGTTPPSVEHLQRPRLGNQFEQNQLDIKIKPKRDLISENSFKPAITFKGKKQPLLPPRNEKNTTPDDLYTSTIYDRTSQQSMAGRNDFERVNTTGEEVVMNQTFQNQILTKKDSQTTISDKLEPKLNQKTLQGNKVDKRKSQLRLNTDLIPVEDKQISALQNTIDDVHKQYPRVKQIKAVDQGTTTTTNVDHLQEFMNLVSSAFDQLINQFSPEELEQKEVLPRVQNFSNALFRIHESLKNSRLSLHEENTNDQPLNSGRSIKKSPRAIPAASQFERPGLYSLAVNPNKQQRVTVKTVGRIGGGFMGHSAK